MEQKNKNLCTLYLVRHGETESNKSCIINGHFDTPLTETGLEQAKATAHELKNVSFGAIFSSDLPRTYRTAEIIKMERQLDIQTTKALRWRTYGHWEGKSRDEYRKHFQHIFDKIKTLSEKEQKEFKLAPDIESDEQVISRFILQLREIAVVHPRKTVLVVTHGGCIRMFLMHIGYMKYGELPGGSFSNAGYAKILFDGANFFVKAVKGIK